MVSYRRNVGRLVEIRVRGERDVSQFGRVIALANELGPNEKVVICNDARGAPPLNPEEAAALATIMRATRERVQVGVMLVAAPINFSQAQRVQDDSHADAGVVRTPEEAIARLAPHLNAAELARLKQFLSEDE